MFIQRYSVVSLTKGKHCCQVWEVTYVYFFNSCPQNFLNVFFNLLKERSPEQIIQMARTLPPLGECFLKSSLHVTSNTSPICFSTINIPESEPVKERRHEEGDLSPGFAVIFWELCSLALLKHKWMLSLNTKEGSGSALTHRRVSEWEHRSWEAHKRNGLNLDHVWKACLKIYKFNWKRKQWLNYT